jgi:hypothetical protein
VLRAGLVAGAAAVLSGCGVRLGSPSRLSSPEPPGPDELARQRVAQDADALRALAARAGALLPADRKLLAAVAADHRAHATALRPASAAGPSAGRSAGTSAGGSVTSAGFPSPTPRTSPGATTSVTALTAATALPALVRAERAAAAAATAELDRVGGDVARLLASIAASRSLHVRTLSARLAAGSAARGVGRGRAR